MSAVNLRIAVLLLALGVPACAGVKSYSNAAPKNVVVRTETDGKVRVSLHVHEVDAKCQTQYRGTVALDPGATDLGIPAERFSYLVVTFDTSSFMSGSSTSSVGTLLKPRAGYGYDVNVSYRKNIYNVAIRETDARRNSSRDISRRDLSTCWLS